MPKFSVKKPLTILVAVIAILVLGVVAYTKMTPDLLPNMDFPYVMIMTSYPGASPEKVEAEVSKPLEQSMSTLEHILEVTSTSSENVSLVMLEFEESVNMDTIGVDIQQQITSLSAGWDDMVGTPYVLKINPSMLPVEVAALSMEGKDTLALTDFLNDTLMNKLEGIPGVARISTTGMVEQELHVVLDQDLIDEWNARIADAVNAELDDAADELKEKQRDLKNAKSEMAGAEDKLNEGANAIVAGQTQLAEEKQKLQQAQLELEAQLEQAEQGRIALTATYETLNTLQDQVDRVVGAQTAAQDRVDTLESLAAQREEIEDLRREIADLEASAGQEPVDPPEASEEPDQEEGLEAAEAAAFSRDAGQIRVVPTAYTGETLRAVSLAAEDEELLAQKRAELIQLEAAHTAQLAAAGVSDETLDAALTQARAAEASADQAVDRIDAILASQGTDRAGLTATVAQTKDQLDQVEDGIAQLEDALEQLDDGMLTVEEAEAMLQQQSLLGMLQMSTAAGKLAAGASSIEMGLSQVESGLETIEDSREGALRQADLNNIITMDMVTQILNAQNFAMPAGYVEQDGISYMVSVGDEITDLKTLENLLLFDMGLDGVDPICLKDVAVVTLTDNSAETYAKLNGQDGVMLSFEKQSTYSTAEATNNIAARFRQLEEEYPGLTFVSLMNQGDYIYIIVDSIMNSLLLGAVFAILVLFLFLRDLRPTFITLCSIPISVIFAIVLMYFSGVTINMISLSGLAVAVGMLVDNSVVVIENIYRLRSKGANVIQAAVSGASQVAGAVTASTLTTVCVFLPIVFVEGITRQLFTDLALTMSYALLASLVVSLTLVPAMASGLLRKDRPVRKGLLEKFVMPAYQKAVAWALRFKPVVLLAALALLIVSGAVALARGFTFMPKMDMATVSVTVSMPENTDMQTACVLADEVLARVDTLGGIETVGAMMGSGSGLGGSSGGHDVTIYITLSDEDGSGEAMGRAIEEACEDLACTVTASSSMMDMSAVTGSGISLSIYADDMDALQAAARKSAQVLESIQGVAQVSDGLEDAAPAFHIAVDRNAAMEKGLTVAQIYMELAAGLTEDGTVASLELDGISTDVIIEKPAGAVLDAQELRDYVFQVTDREGEVTDVPLSDIAVVEDTTSLTSINRQDQRRYLSVSAELEEGYNVTLLTSQAERAIADVDLGPGVNYTFTGENETIMESVEQLMLMLLLGVLLVYLVMVAQFQSLKSPFIVMFTIPLAFTGGFLALLICGLEVSVISLIGFIMLTGIIVNNGIVLVDYINQLRQDGRERREAIVEAGVTRMRPILMTTITTVLGLLDMAVRQSAGTAMMKPIAVVCIGGLLYATLMTLFVVPCIYDVLSRKELRNVREEDLKLLDL